MDNKLHCPYCGGLLKIASYDEDVMGAHVDEQGIETFIVMVWGRCNTCNRKFNWMAEYELKLLEVTSFEGVDY